MNSYFNVGNGRGFRVFRHLGTSASNCYVGASRAFLTVMEAINARTGDEIHTLVGGTFMVRDGVVSPISLRAPKPLFEKSYGGHDPDSVVMKRYVKRGLATEIPAPSGKFDYAAARERVFNNHLRELHPEIVHVENSPEFVELNSVVQEFAADLVRSGLACEIKAADINAYGGPRFDLVADGQKIRVGSGAYGVFFVEVPASVDALGVKDPLVSHDRKTHHFRSIDGVVDPLLATRDFLTAVVTEMAPAAPEMGV